MVGWLSGRLVVDDADLKGDSILLQERENGPMGYGTAGGGA